MRGESMMQAVFAGMVTACAGAGIPDNGKPFPEGSKMAKIHWNPKKETYPGQPTVPGIQHDADFMVKDSKRFADSSGWSFPLTDLAC
jgi:hypothetical protein